MSSSYVWIIGVLINLVGQVLINFGANIIKLSHNRAKVNASRHSVTVSSDESNPNNSINSGSAPPPQKSTLCLKANHKTLWRFGYSFFFLGNILNFFSFSLAAQSLLATISSVQFISNIFFSSVILREKVTPHLLFCTAGIIVGNAFTIVFSQHASKKITHVHELVAMYSRPSFIVYMFFATIVSVFLLAFYMDARAPTPKLFTWVDRKTVYRSIPVAFAGSAGLLCSISVLLAKSLSLLAILVFSGDYMVFAYWYALPPPLSVRRMARRLTCLLCFAFVVGICTSTLRPSRP